LPAVFSRTTHKTKRRQDAGATPCLICLLKR
jgi:hypothetical protein